MGVRPVRALIGTDLHSNSHRLPLNRRCPESVCESLLLRSLSGQRRRALHSYVLKHKKQGVRKKKGYKGKIFPFPSGGTSQRPREKFRMKNFFFCYMLGFLFCKYFSFTLSLARIVREYQLLTCPLSRSSAPISLYQNIQMKQINKLC